MASPPTASDLCELLEVEPVARVHAQAFKDALHNCPGRKPPFWLLSARRAPAIQNPHTNRFTVGNGEGA